MKGRSRLDRYQNLQSNTSDNETNVNEENEQRKQMGNYPNFRSGYSRKTSRSRLYQTSEYDSLLKEHEEFLRSLDEQFGSIDQSGFSTVEPIERQTYSTQPSQSTAQPSQQEYTQPVQQQYRQQSYIQQKPQQGYLQQQFTQPTQRVKSEPQQYVQQPFVQQFQQEPVARATIEPSSQFEQQISPEKAKDFWIEQKTDKDIYKTEIYEKAKELEKEEIYSEKVRDSLVFGPVNVEPEEELFAKSQEIEYVDKIKKTDAVYNVFDEFEEISDEEFFELEPIEDVEEIIKDDVAFEFVKPDFEKEALTEIQDIFVVDGEEEYFEDSYQSELQLEPKPISQEEIIEDFDLIDEDFDAKELDDNKIIEVIDEEDSKRVINNFLKEPVDELVPDDDFDYFEKEEYDYTEKDLIDDLDEKASHYSETNVFKFIDDILVDVKNDAEMIHTQQPKQDYFDVEEEKTVEDITKVLSEWNLDELEFVDAESIMPTFDEDGIEVAQDIVYQATNPVHTPVYYDDPVVVDELTQKLENERALRQQMLEQTKQIKLQVKEYENELESVNSSMSKTNKILNFVLTLLIMTLFVILFVIGFWFAQERGLI